MARAVVARSTGNGLQYLRRQSANCVWVGEVCEAEAFTGLREATRVALELPGQLRAFALPFGSADPEFNFAARTS